MKHAWTATAASLVVLVGCVRPPAPLAGTFADTTVSKAQQTSVVGTRVRWGGSIVSVTPRADETCFEVVSHPLDAAARPEPTDVTGGRFLACAAGFYDPAVYEVGRDLTIVGTVGENVEGKIGDREYRFPRVAAEQVYLWPKRERDVVYRSIYDPFWYPYWGPYRRRW